MSLWFSRLTLSSDPGNAALSTLLDPRDEGQAMNAHHALLWALFSDGAERRRDFLWRADSKGRFFTLSEREPQPHPLFEPPETKAFAPELSAGDRLSFVLRANATRDQAAISRLPREERRGKSRRVDLVMQLLKDIPQRERAKARQELAEEAAAEWFARQGAAHGFSPESLNVEGYRRIAIPREGRKAKHAVQLGVLDLAGELKVTDPAAFTARLGQGFGRSRAFGCGLMMIRRA